MCSVMGASAASRSIGSYPACAMNFVRNGATPGESAKNSESIVPRSAIRAMPAKWSSPSVPGCASPETFHDASW